MPGLESPGIFVEVLESPGIWTYRSIFLIISVKEFSCYTSSEMWVYHGMLKVSEFIEKVLEFDIERSWKVLESEMSKCVWTLNNIEVELFYLEYRLLLLFMSVVYLLFLNVLIFFLANYFTTWRDYGSSLVMFVYHDCLCTWQESHLLCVL